MKPSMGIWFLEGQSKQKTLKKIKLFNIITLFYHTLELF